jgi:MFS family permease
MPEVRVVIAVTFVIMLGFGILGPVLPQYARSFGVDYTAVGWLITSFALTRLVFDLVAGPLVNRFGERAMATAGAIFVGVSSALAAMAPTFAWLLVLRGAGGAGSSVFFAALMSYMFRTVPPERMGRVMGVFYGAFNLGIIAGQPIGGVTAAAWGLASPLWLYAIACVLSGILYLVAIPALPRRVREPDAPRGLRSLPWTRPFVTVLVLNLAYAWMVGGAWSTLIPLFGSEEIGLSVSGVGLAISLAAAAEFAVLYHAGSASDRYGRKAVMVPAFTALFAVLAVMGFADAIWAFAATLVLMGLSAGYAGVPPAAMLNDVAPPRESATAIGVYRFSADLGFMLGPLVAGWSANVFGFPIAFALSGLPSLVGVGLLVSIAETRRVGGPEGSEALPMPVADGGVEVIPERP